jgi:hypothetical protein
MPTPESFLAVLGGLALRLALPLAITIVLVSLLRRLDARWQADVQAQAVSAPVIHCWEVNQCPPESRQTCPAYLNSESPCWQQFRAANGDVRTRCLACELFRAARVPVARVESGPR